MKVQAEFKKVKDYWVFKRFVFILENYQDKKDYRFYSTNTLIANVIIILAMLIVLPIPYLVKAQALEHLFFGSVLSIIGILLKFYLNSYFSNLIKNSNSYV